ncbi:hypothetical protein [Sphingomonas gilva]|uniref:hypothetical protein n=1 Tax=Sphingomonas gilva TaxID=2305907 RepID=UPI0011C379B8|nr:hypothetical protein [Sphingomonas gilva]
MITIGIDFGGPEHRESDVSKILIKASQVAARVRDPGYDDGQEAWINPIFVVPGTINEPDFTGHKLGHFSKKEKGLSVAIAVPQSVADGKGIQEFIGQSLREAVRLAAAYFASKGISFSTLKAEKIILAIEANLANATAI